MPTSDSRFLICTFLRENPNTGECETEAATKKSRLHRLCLCSRSQFWKGLYLQLSDKSDNMKKYLIFFYVLGYIGEDSAISDALGPRSKIMLISDMLSLEATCRKSKVLDALLSHIGT